MPGKSRERVFGRKGIILKRTIASNTDRLFDIINTILLIVITFLVVYPMYFIVISSISNPDAVNEGKVVFFPVGISFAGYEKIFQDGRIWLGYRNTIFYTLAGTTLNVLFTLMAGYSLSRKDLYGKNIIMGFFVFTMYFNGGLIPTYLIVKSLGLINTPFVMIILGAVGVWNIIITRTFYQSTLSPELLEAAFLDGCTNQSFFFRIVLPLSSSIIAVLVLFYGVNHWNQYINALMYLSSRNLYPLQIILKDILIASEMTEQIDVDIHSIGTRERYAELVKYGLIIVASVPVLTVYPFLQRYFVKGIMIGALKG